MSEEYIVISGAKVNNLKNISVSIPRNKLVVITGLSGSGKSSLAFDTLYAEGQRRYAESLSSYARQFMNKLSKPDVESVVGIPPAIAIEQRTISRNPRSTVGTATEIYEYLKLLFARIGHTFSPISGKEVKRETVQDVWRAITEIADNAKVYIMAPMCIVSGRSTGEQLEILRKQGFSRVVCNKTLVDIDDLILEKKISKNENIFILIDRFKATLLEENRKRIIDSINTAFSEGKGVCVLQIEEENAGEETKIPPKHRYFSHLFSVDGVAFEEPSVNLFNFSNPYGACKTCGGTGATEGIDPDLVIPNKLLSVYEGAVVCWRGEKLSEWKNEFIHSAIHLNFPIHRPISHLSEVEFNLLWNGNDDGGVKGVLHFFAFVEANLHKVQYRVLQARYRGKTICPTCRGTRLRPDANYVQVAGKSISDLVLQPVDALHQFFSSFQYKSENEKTIAQLIITELVNRLGFLVDVGLGYLTLNRLSRTLSGGESQRINLATSLGSSLVGSLYILDEPSIGLHSRDTQKLIQALHRLRDIGNTVIVVEHDEEIIREADYIVDIGPKAGQLGGEVVFTGSFAELLQQPNNLTAAYLRGMTHSANGEVMKIEIPKQRRIWRNFVEIKGAMEHNLKNVNVKIPLEVFVAITGVSGSGKSTLITDILYPALLKMKDMPGEKPGLHSQINADMTKITEILLIDQNPIGRSSRSNPATYCKVYDSIRELFSLQPLAQMRNYKPGFFSFNTPGGRCEECEGEGMVHIGMQFMADVDLVCSECNGTRFKEEALEIKVAGKTIYDILNMTIQEALDFFRSQPSLKTVNNIIRKMQPLQDVGLGYLRLGQSSASLSGGEAQRIKLAYFLGQSDLHQHALFIFDEPTTGLHFHDIHILFDSLNRLIEKGNSVVVIEHNLELIKCADWIIDLGPDGGANGGNIVFEGTPEELSICKNSYTGYYLKRKVKRRK